MPPVAITDLQRDTSVQPQATPEDTPSPQNSPRYVLPLILALSSTFLLASLLLWVVLKRHLGQNKGRTIGRLDVDVSVDIYTVKSECEVKDTASCSNSPELVESERFSSRCSLASPLVCEGDDTPPNASGYLLGQMLGCMDVEFLSQSTVRFPRMSLPKSSSYAKGSSNISSFDGHRASHCEQTKGSGEIRLRKRESSLPASHSQLRYCELPSLEEARACRALDNLRGSYLSRDSIALPDLRTSSSTISEQTGNTPRLPVTPSGSGVYTRFITDHVANPNHHAVQTVGKRPYSTTSFLLPDVSKCSPLLLTSLTPLCLEDSPSTSHRSTPSPISVDLGTVWPSHSPLLSVELSIEDIHTTSDDTLVAYDARSDLKSKIFLADSTRLSVPNELGPETTPRICVQLAETPSSDSSVRLEASTPSSNLLAQPTPIFLSNASYEPLTGATSIQTIARVLQPLLESLETGTSQFAASLGPTTDPRLESRNSVSSLLSAFAFPLLDTSAEMSSQLKVVHSPLASEILTMRSDARADKGLLTPYSCTSTRIYTPARRRSRSRTSSISSTDCSTRSPSIRQVSVRPSAPTPGSLLSRLSLHSPRPYSPTPSSSDTYLTPSHGPPFQRPDAPTPGSALSQASPDNSTGHALPSFLTPPSWTPQSRARTSIDTSPYSRPHAPTPGSIGSLYVSG